MAEEVDLAVETKKFPTQARFEALHLDSQKIPSNSTSLVQSENNKKKPESHQIDDALRWFPLLYSLYIASIRRRHLEASSNDVTLCTILL
jgi:hypothetical protein